MTKVEEKLKSIAKTSPKGGWKEKVRFRNQNKAWLRKSSAIALKILDALDLPEWNQARLARELKVSPQVVSKWVKGHENFTLETLSKIEAVLGIELITIRQEDEIVVKKNELNSLKYLEEVVIKSSVKVQEVLKYSELLEHTYIETNVGTKGNQKSLKFMQSKSFKSEQRFAIAS